MSKQSVIKLAHLNRFFAGLELSGIWNSGRLVGSPAVSITTCNRRLDYLAINRIGIVKMNKKVVRSGVRTA